MRWSRLVLFLVLMVLAVPMAVAQEENVSREEAVSAIEVARQDIDAMVDAGFSTKAVNDSLAEAELALRRADFAEALRNNETGEFARRAREALRGLDYERFTYEDVVVHTREIEERRERAFMISDRLRALELEIGRAGEQGVNTSRAEGLMVEARDAFERERYTEAERSIESAEADIEERRGEIARLQVVVDAGRGFLADNWVWMLAVIVVSAVFVSTGYMWWRRSRLEDEMERLKVERHVLGELMKKAQRKRFHEGSLPRSVYETRMDVYRSRLAEVDDRLPVLERRLGGSDEDE